MAVTIHASGSQTCSAATEHTIVATDTTAGVFALYLDLNDISSSEDLIIRIKEKAQNSSGTQRVVWQDYVAFVQGPEKIWVSPALMLINGWAMSIESNGTPVIPWHVTKG